jgi:uncharacterized protein YcbX
MQGVTVASLHVYPLKAARGLEVSEARITPFGFEHDRRFMVVDEKGRFLTQRTHPALALVHVRVAGSDGTSLTLSAPRLDRVATGPVTVTVPGSAAPRRTVRVWGDTCEVVAVADKSVEAFLSAVCKEPVGLVYMPDDCKRPVDDKYAAPDDRVSFADGFPFLVTTTGALDTLNAALVGEGSDAVPMARFRPNIVLQADGPFPEDGWARVRIGTVEFELPKGCTRCTVITVDQDTGVVGKEPLATLAKVHSRDKKVIFGQNAIARGSGIVRVGDSVEVLEQA